MEAGISVYFRAEKHESALFVVVGLCALGASGWLLRNGGPYRGMIVPLAAVALIQLVVGGSVWLRTDAQLARLLEQAKAGPPEYQRVELARMNQVMANFRAYKAIEIAVLLVGITLALAFPHRPGLYAAGIGCIIQGALMLVLDLFAEQRGRAYIDAVHRIT